MATLTSGYDTGGAGGSTPQNRMATISSAAQFRSCPMGSTLTRDENGEFVCVDAQGRKSKPMTGTPSYGGGEAGENQQTLASKTIGIINNILNDTQAQGGSDTGYTLAGADIFAQRPSAMLADIIERSHPNDNRGFGLYGMLEPYADAANVLFLALQGTDAEGGTKEQFLNWLENDYWNALMTPLDRGGGIDWRTAIDNVLNAPQNSPLIQYLAVQDPQAQAQNFINIMAGIYGTAFHPLVASSMLDRMYYGRDEFLGEAARQGIEGMDPFYQWIQQSMPTQRWY